MLEKVHLTNIFLEKQKCVTKEVMMDYYRGNESITMSIGDRIEEFMALVTNQDCYFSGSSQQEWDEEGFQLKMLTDQEKMLLKTRDTKFLENFHSFNDNTDNPGEIRPDIPLPEMAESESNAKFALSMGFHNSITLCRSEDIKEKLEETGFQESSDDVESRDIGSDKVMTPDTDMSENLGQGLGQESDTSVRPLWVENIEHYFEETDNSGENLNQPGPSKKPKKS